MENDPFEAFLYVLLLLNGAYDTLCAAVLLLSSPDAAALRARVPHLAIFRDPQTAANHLLQTYIAFWVATYAPLRLVAALFPARPFYIVAAYSYFIEAACYLYLTCLLPDTLHAPRTAFVVVCSAAIGALLVATVC